VPIFVIGSGVGDNYATLLLTLPDVAWFKSAVMGALYELTVADNWIEFGDVAVSFAVEESAQMVAGYRFMNFNPFPVGLILPFGSETPPAAFLLCDGGSYDTEAYPELFSAIGYSFGGSGGAFNVPNLLNRTVVGMGDDFDFAISGGEVNHTLDTSEIPSHTHTIPLTATTLAVEPGEVTVLTPVPFFTQDTGATGGDGSHNNMQPYIALSYVIYAGRV
jgi:microcystin-dependent protein